MPAFNLDELLPNTDQQIARLRQAIARAVAPPPMLTVSEWADRYRYLSAESSAEPGKWNTDRAPYQRGIMDSVNEAGVDTIVVMSSAQVGKTETLNNVVGYYVSQDPSPIMVVQPTLEMAETWSKDRLTPMLRDTPALSGKVKDAKARDSGNTLLHKQFPGGHITMAGANSPASLASRPIRVVLCDEVDRFPASAGTEGDPVDLAAKRTTTFWNKKLILTSTPTEKDSSRIEMAWNESDQRRFFVPCPHCGTFDYLRWREPNNGPFRVMWPEGDPHAAYYVCADCGGVITDAHKTKMLRRGEWRPTATGRRGVAGYHLNELYSPWRRFGDVAADFVKAKKSPETLKVWVNTSLGEPWEDEYTARLDAEGLAKRVEFYDMLTVPDGGLLITAGLDVQDNRIEIVQRAWGEGEESWLVNQAVIFGDPSQAEIWTQVNNVLDTPLHDDQGREFYTLTAAIDTGGHYTHEVYAWVRDRQSKYVARRTKCFVIAIKGQSQSGKAAIGKPTKVDINRKGQTLKRGVDLYPAGVDTVKGLIYGRLKITEAGAGCYHWPASTPKEYFDQLTAEKKKTKFVNGYPRTFWEKKNGDRNEALDCEVYAYVSLQHFYTRVNRVTIWEQLRQKLGVQKPAEIEAEQPSDIPPPDIEPAQSEPMQILQQQRRPQQARRPRGGGFVQGFRR